jgi:hypothetical protein
MQPTVHREYDRCVRRGRLAGTPEDMHETPISRLFRGGDNG